MTNSLPADRLGLGAYVTTWGPPGKPLPRWDEMRAIGVGLEQIGVEVSGGRLILGIGAGVGPTDHRWAELGYDSEKHIGRFVERRVRVRAARRSRSPRAGRERLVSPPAGAMPSTGART